MIDLTKVKLCLKETQRLIDQLDGIEHDDRSAITSQSSGALRRERAKTSHDLQLLATRLELAAQLVRIEYWHARGECDPLTPERSI